LCIGLAIQSVLVFLNHRAIRFVHGFDLEIGSSNKKISHSVARPVQSTANSMPGECPHNTILHGNTINDISRTEYGMQGS
jgi:hypothetical protein